MATGTFEYRTDAERKAIEQAIAFVGEMNDLALTAPAGHVLDQCEGRAVDGGRDLLRGLLAQAVQARVDAAEEKKGRRGSAPAGSPFAGSAGVPAR